MVVYRANKSLSKRELNKQRIIEIEEQNGLLRIDKAREKIPVGKDTWIKGCQSGRFPKGVKGGSNAHLWEKSDIDTLMEYARINGNIWNDTTLKWENVKKTMAAIRSKEQCE